LWLAVAALHVWLIARRFATGQWSTPMDDLRAFLCLAAVGYASLKFWRIATLFDAGPRRALTFALILLLGHWAVAAPQNDMAGGPGASAFIALIAVLPALGLAAVGLLVLARWLRWMAMRPRKIVVVHASLDFSFVPIFLAQFFPSLFHRPPPVCA